MGGGERHRSTGAAQEDRRLPTGKRALWDGLVLTGRVHAAFARSPDAHARIRSVEKGRRSRFRAQLAVLIGADCVADGLRPISAQFCPGHARASQSDPGGPAGFRRNDHDEWQPDSGRR
jgi:CO/xanthine dehydrogenase Mo-binding subunit